MKSTKLKVCIETLPRLSINSKESEDYCERSPYSGGPIMIVPNLYLGSNRAANDTKSLKRLGIKCVINVAKEVPIADIIKTPELEIDRISAKEVGTALSTKCVEPKKILMQSSPIERVKFAWAHNEDLTAVIDGPIDLIDKCLGAKVPVLVHCLQGVSRSPALIIGYLMKIRKIPLSEAYELVKSKSPSISPNVFLISHLTECERLWQ